MEQFLLDNAERYKNLVAKFRPVASGPKASDSTTATPEIVVCSRLRPMLEDELAQGFPVGVYLRGNTNTVDLHELKQPVRGLPRITSSDYTVDRAFGPDATTAEIYDSLIHPLVPWAWGGGVATMFAFGQTYSGKTYTVSFLERQVAETLMDGSLSGERNIYISIIELAGQTAYDLLNARRQISILEDSFGVTQMAGALEHQVTNKESLLDYIEAAASLRRTAPTMKNDSSSRSHAICRIRFENHALPSSKDGLLYMVDLAGSEAARDKAIHDVSRMKEAREINTSLSVLKDCIRGRALADADSFAGKSGKKPAYIPFRQSTLTKTLKHVFDPASGRSCKTVVVACVNPCLADIGASKNTLRYAEMLRVVMPKTKPAEYHPGVPATWNNEQLRSWIQTNSGDPAINPTPLAPTETGPQLLRLPMPEFLSRCLQTPDVSAEQAQAFQAKLWKLHVDSQRAANRASASASSSKASNNSGSGKPGSGGRLEMLDSSADPEPGSAEVPFQQRIRPGMVVGWKPSAAGGYESFSVGGKAYAMVMCPREVVGERVRDVRGEQVNGKDTTGSSVGGEGKGETGEAYLCAMVAPALLPGSYGISPWRQVVVRVEEMEAEVLMEWDEATRYYYMTV
ncbi:P-loop containing nucleoside triphosphate hydrolase protein [Chaetomidium leptoderma]|uniref:P-loop containing nucleoside triphosphate hydrolase protein n=1 Tax=Chaetomidium leptoderma TaxID=669021 RepID=A0AAN6ZVD9_9PEZI|nr:P-loop containing nucleoside triphosphate hydrolase protein [Chaetomidium leptoderma]